jgi:hypothetical protein
MKSYRNDRVKSIIDRERRETPDSVAQDEAR